MRPTQSGHLSPSIEKENRDGETETALVGAERGTVTPSETTAAGKAAARTRSAASESGSMREWGMGEGTTHGIYTVLASGRAL